MGSSCGNASAARTATLTTLTPTSGHQRLQRKKVLQLDMEAHVFNPSIQKGSVVSSTLTWATELRPCSKNEKKKKKRREKKKKTKMNDKVREEGLLKFQVCRRELRWVLHALLQPVPTPCFSRGWREALLLSLF